MEQRPLRLGDIVDDYCTRERRVTNHAIVAVVENSIRQTRCTTCDTEHAYKGGKEPRLRKKSPTSGLYDQVLADVTNGERVEVQASKADEVVAGASVSDSAAANVDGAGEEPPQPDGEFNGDPQAGEYWPAHRRLIRATLPRTDNEPPAPRPIPEFTMHRRPPSRGGGRGFRFRGNGDVPSGNGFGQGHSSGRPGRHRGKKRR